MFPRHRQRSIALYLSLTVAFLLLGALLLLRPAATRAQNQPEALGSISGTVRNAQGDPLPNITVWLEHYTNQYGVQQVKSDSNGVYRFFSVLSGVYRLRFEDAQKEYVPQYYLDGYFGEDATTITVNGNNVSGIDMELGTGGAISLTLQSTNGVTITYYGATLYKQTASGGWANYRQVSGYSYYPYENYTNEKYLLLDTLPDGTYRLCVQAGDYSYYMSSVECYDNLLPKNLNQLPPTASDITVEVGKETTLTITVNDLAQLEGFILSPTGQPLSGIYINLRHLNSNSYGVSTDHRGYFHFGYITQGVYNVNFNYNYGGFNPYLSLYYPNTISPQAAAEVIIDETTRISLTRRLTPEARIIGKVSLPTNGTLEWASINLFRQAQNGTWYQPGCYEYCPGYQYDSITGIYTATQLLAGRYKILASSYIPGSQTSLEGYYGGTTFDDADEIVVAVGESKNNINITLGASEFDSAISGQVTAGGVPRAGIEVGLFSQYTYQPPLSAMPFVTTMTDAQGRYTLAGLARGFYQVGFRDSAGIYATAFYTSSNFEYIQNGVAITTTGIVSNINMALSPGGTIRGHVRTQNGASSSGFVIEILPNTPDFYGVFLPLPYIDVRTDATGAFAVTGLPPGSYYVRATTPVGSGEYPNPIARLYPAGDEPNDAQLLHVEAGKTLDGKDILFFFEPTNFLPIIDGPPVDPSATLTPVPTPTFAFPAPGPWPTPTATPDFP